MPTMPHVRILIYLARLKELETEKASLTHPPHRRHLTPEQTAERNLRIRQIEESEKEGRSSRPRRERRPPGSIRRSAPRFKLQEETLIKR